MTFQNRTGLGALILLALIAGSYFAWPRGPEIEGVGYFKDDANNRIRTFELAGEVTSDEVYGYARNLPYTGGRLGAAYFYPAGSVIPADGVTLAANIFAANGVLYEAHGLSPWRFAYMRAQDGDEEFVDCRVVPDHELCRP